MRTRGSVGRTRQKSPSVARRSAEAASTRNRRGGAPQANPLAAADPPRPAHGAGGPDPRAAGSHAAELQEALRTPASRCAARSNGSASGLKKKRYTRRNTIALTSAAPARSGAPRRRRSIPRASCFSMRVVCGPPPLWPRAVRRPGPRPHAGWPLAHHDVSRVARDRPHRASRV